MTIKNVGLVGVGLLGSAVASRLLEHGFAVAGHDVRPEPVDALVAKGLRAAKNVAGAAAGADAVITVLTTPAVVESVWLGASGVLETAPKSAVLMQMSTVSPELSRRLGE